MHCKYVSNATTLNGNLRANTKDMFNAQFHTMLATAKEPSGIVYVWRSDKPIPRLKDSSPIIYIGKTKTSLYSRYRRYVEQDTDTFWDRYEHIMSGFGGISIDIYETTEPAITENEFLFQYQMQFFEAPPLNTQRYKTSLLDDESYQRFGLTNVYS